MKVRKCREGVLNMGQNMKQPCEVITYFRNGRIYPLKFRYYQVECARYLTVKVDRVNFIRVLERNGLKEMTYHVEGRRKQYKDRYALYLEPRSKTWWVV